MNRVSSYSSFSILTSYVKKSLVVQKFLHEHNYTPVGCPYLRPLCSLSSIYFNSNTQVDKMHPMGLAKTYLHSDLDDLDNLNITIDETHNNYHNNEFIENS